MFFKKTPRLIFLFIIVQLFISCSNSDTNLISKISFYNDLSNTVEVTQVAKLPFKNIKENPLNLNQKHYWFKITLNKKAHKKSIGLKIDEAYVKSLAIFNSNLEKQASFINPNTARFYIPLHKPTTVIYAKIVFKRNPFLIAEAYFTKELKKIETKDIVKNTAYYIVIILFFALVLSLAYFFSNTIFLWYAFFQFSVNLIIALFDNTLAGFISNEKLLNHSIGISFLIIPIATTLYSTKALNVKLYYPKLFKGLLLLFIPLTILNILFHSTHNFSILAYQDLFNSVLYIIIFILCIVLYKKVSFAKYFLLGYSILFIVGILYSINVNFGYRFLPFDIITLKMGVLIEIIVLTYATILRAKEVLKENEIMRLELNKHINQILVLEDVIKNKESSKQEVDNKIISLITKYNLTDREADVFLYIAKGLSNKQIADQLFVSVNTIKYHTRNIYEKMDVHKRSEITSKVLMEK